MRTGKELIQASKAFAKEDRKKSWWFTLSTLLLLILALAGTYWNISILGRIGCSILSGLLLVRMFVIYHDHQHFAILSNSKIANSIMSIFGIYILAPSSIWKRSHDFHHNHNSKLHVSDIGSFPTITKHQFLALSKKQQFIYLALRHPLNILLGYLTIFTYSFCANSFIKSSKRHWDCGLALFIHLALGVFLLLKGGWLALLLTLVGPHFIACAMGSYLFYVQHNFPGASFKVLHDWKYDYAALYSTSYLIMNPVMRWFTGNIGLHHVHHLNSRIPFYRLEEAMVSMPELNTAVTTSFRLKDVISCLRLKLWDDEKQTMIGLKELSNL
jgi:omega-6 fatty acid desaturase (delta-12 desaturase)